MRLPVLFLLVTLAGAAAAQTVYRYVTPDGRTIFSDQPVPGAKLQGTVAPPPPPSGSPAPAPAPVESRTAAPAEPPGAARQQQLRQATQEVEAAQQALAQARAQLEAGKEPLPGERTGTAGGGSRLNEAYWARQAENEQAVAKAQARLDAATTARNRAL
jgi:flagellar hook-basal body complex protein FliE